MKRKALLVPLVLVGVPVGASLAFGSSLWPVLGAGAVYGLLISWGASQDNRKLRTRRSDLPQLVFIAFMIFGLPAALAMLVATGWQAILAAYAIWFGLLGLWALHELGSKSVSKGEAVGWPMIFAMLATFLVVPVLTLFLRLAGWPA